MQDRYAGDVGDFLKLLLLRRLTSAADDGPALSMGIVWYRTTHEEANADGKHISYLDRRTTRDIALCKIDEELSDCLTPVATASPRSVADLQTCGALPPSTTYFDQPLSWEGISPFQREDRLRFRQSWLQSALEATALADLVFLDPDNGLRPSNHRQPRTRKTAVKYTYLDEVIPFLDRRQSLVVYHHAGRNGTVDQQVSRLFDLVESDTTVRPTAVVRASRGTVRLFVVLAHPAHEEVLRSRLASLDGLGGSDTLRVY